MRVTTLDGKPLAWPQPGVNVVHVGPFSYLLVLDGVFIGPPPSGLGER
jgi:hypothetical protein